MKIRIADKNALLAIYRALDQEYELACDIDLDGARWQPIGSSCAPFSGMFDGKGHCVRNFVISQDSDCCGFFGVNEGTVLNLQLENMHIDHCAKADCAMGSIAGVNHGSIVNVSAQGCKIDAALLAGEIRVGGIAGSNTGIIRNVTIQCHVNLRAEKAVVFAGGLLGVGKGGFVETTKLKGRFEVKGPEKQLHVGLFAGSLTDSLLSACTMGASMNTINGKVFQALTGEAGTEHFEGCLWRDNRNSDELLTEESLQLREKSVEHIRKMATVKWTPDKDMVYRCSCGGVLHNQQFKAGTTYKGLPYSHKGGSYERFLACFREDGTLQPWIKTEGWDGMDLYMGCDCSAAVYWAWSRVSPDITFRFTGNMIPAAKEGSIGVGPYDCSMDDFTNGIIEANTPEAIYESYARLSKGDAVVTILKSGGHTRMCAQNAVVYRNTHGVIDKGQSYVVTIEQGDGLYPKHKENNSSWLVDWKYTFLELRSARYIPISTPVLQSGVSPQPEVTYEKTEGDGNLHSGRVVSNYRIISVSAKLLKEKACIWDYTLFTAVHPWAEDFTDVRMRDTVKEVDLSEFKPYFNKKLTPGETYRYEVSAQISTGEVFIVNSATFTFEGRDQ